MDVREHDEQGRAEEDGEGKEDDNEGTRDQRNAVEEMGKEEKKLSELDIKARIAKAEEIETAQREEKRRKRNEKRRKGGTNPDEQWEGRLGIIA